MGQGQQQCGECKACCEKSHRLSPDAVGELCDNRQCAERDRAKSGERYPFQVVMGFQRPGIVSFDVLILSDEPGEPGTKSLVHP